MSRTVGGNFGLSSESTLLYLIAGPPANASRIAALPLDSLDWTHLCALALRAKALPALWEGLDQMEPGSVPEEVRPRLRNLAMVTDFRQKLLEQRFLSVMDRLGQEGIRPVLLKGAALAVSAYDSFEQRQMGDFDLLAKPTEAALAQRLLCAAGWKKAFPDDPDTGAPTWRDQFYALHHHLPPLVAPDGSGIAVEIHTDLLPPGGSVNLSAASFRQAAVEVCFRGRTLLVPRPLDQVLHLCVHFAWSHMLRNGGWRTFRDLRALQDAGGIPWNDLVSAAETARAKTCCYWTLRLAGSLSGLAVPADVMRALEPPLADGVIRRLERHFAHELLPSASSCPSERLSRRLWEMAIMPSQSGHGAARPWLHPGDAHAPTPQSTATAGNKFLSHLQRVKRWNAYGRVLFGEQRATP